MTALQFQTIISGHMSALEGMTMRFSSNKEDANDLLQDTLLKALKNREKFKPNTNIKAWLFTIMRNTYINGYNRNLRSKIDHDTTEGQYFLNTSNRKSLSPVESKANYNEIKEIVDRLEDVYRIPFQKMFEGFKYKEIADELDLPIGTVKSRIFFARQKLAEIISAE